MLSYRRFFSHEDHERRGSDHAEIYIPDSSGVEADYRYLRRYQPHHSNPWQAKATLCWEHAKAVRDAERLGTIRFAILPDWDPDLSYLEPSDGDTRDFIAASKRERQRAQDDGVWGCVIEAQGRDGDWRHIDSCWGFIGDDWQDFALTQLDWAVLEARFHREHYMAIPTANRRRVSQACDDNPADHGDVFRFAEMIRATVDKAPDDFPAAWICQVLLHAADDVYNVAGYNDPDRPGRVTLKLGDGSGTETRDFPTMAEAQAFAAGVDHVGMDAFEVESIDPILTEG